MFIRYIGVAPLTVQTKEGPIEVITSEVIEVYNEEWNEMRMIHPGLFVQEDHGTNPAGPPPVTSVLIDSGTALVNNQGDDATGVVGDASKPFLTPQAALDAIPVLGTVRLENSAFTGDMIRVGGLFNIVFDNARLDGDVEGRFVFIKGTTGFGNFGGDVLNGQIRVPILTIYGMGSLSTQILPDTTTPGGTSYTITNCQNVNSMAGTPLIGDGTTRSAGIIENISLLSCDQGFPLISNDPVFSTGQVSVLRIRNINSLGCGTIYGGQGELFILRMFAIRELNCVNGIVAGTPDPAQTSQNKINIKDSNFVSTGAGTGRVIDITGGTTPLKISSINCTYEIDATEAVFWTGNPAGLLTLQSSSILSKVRNTTGVVTQTLNNDIIAANYEYFIS